MVKDIKQQFPNLTISFLLQHPNPSLHNTYEHMGQICVRCMVDKLADSIHIVYDVKDGMTCFKQKTLLKLLLSKVTIIVRKKIMIGDEILISKVDNVVVHHPLFGNCHRKEWAKMKQSNEYTFCIKYKQ